MNNDKKFLFIIDGYAPYSNANTVCSNIIAKAINEMGIPIDFYVIKKHPDEFDKQDGINNVFYIESGLYKNCYNVNVKNKKSFYAKIRSYLINKIYGRNLDAETITVDHKKLMDKIKKENLNGKYTHIVSVCFPFGTVKLGNLVKRHLPDSKWIHYMLDPYEYNYAVKSGSVKERKNIFRRYTKNLDKLIITRGIHEEHLRQKYDNGLEHITLVTDLPNLVKRDDFSIDATNTSEHEINLLYSGIFYENIRNPQKMLEIFSRISIANIKFNIYGNACEFLKRKYDNLDCRTVLKGNVPNDIVRQAQMNANILVNLGNTVPNQLPSKVFEYIATGKPIINFYSTEFDTSLYYLEKYPLSFNINVNRYTMNDILLLEKFITDNKNSKTTFEQATKKMQDVLSENVCKKIVNFILEDNHSI